MTKDFKKIETTSVTLILLLTLSAIIATIPYVNAAEYETYAYLALATNPIGVNQNEIVVFWLSLPPPTAFGALGERWENLTVKITAPDGTTETKGPYTSDAIGQGYISYLPTQIGTYQLQFIFPGQTSQNGNYYKASSSPMVSLTVQEEAIEPYPDTPIPGPNDYWQRPISGNNLLWTSFSGNWLGLGAASFGSRNYGANGNFNPYTKAPNTAHIVWTKPNAFGGIIGGEYKDPPTYYTGNSYEPQFTPPIIMNGVLYYNTASPPQYGFQAVDLRTGEDLWYNNSTGRPDSQVHAAELGGIYWPGITNGQIYNYISVNQYGGIPYLWQTAGSIWSLYDAFTGNWILNLANATGGSSGATFVNTPTGELHTYLIGAEWLAMWNSTKAIPTASTIPGYEVWRPTTGGTFDWTNGIEWNVTLPTAVPGQSIQQIDPDSGIILTASSRGAEPGTRIDAGYDMTTGQQLWVKTNTVLIPGSNNYGLQGPMAEGIYTMFVKEEQSWYGFDAYTGQRIWGPTEPTPNAWSIYSNYAIIACGTLYSLTLDGLHAYDLATGEYLWTFTPGSSGFEAIYGVWPFDLGDFTIADGKVYIAAGHSHGILPQFRGAKMYAVDAVTGELVFDILGWMQCGWRNSPIVADGYLVAQNGYDMQIYCFGKGLTETTITVPESVQSLGTPVLIKGTITDQSPGETCLGIPAAGTPAISDEDMSAWMEYLYEQQPKPTDAKGVTVHLTSIDPNGNFQDIGYLTSDITGGYKTMWVPPVPGEYTITATFEGTESYWPSDATTYFGVAEAPSAAQPMEPELAAPNPAAAEPSTPEPTESTTSIQTPLIAPETAIIAAVAVAVIIGVAAFFALRKRK